MNQKYFHPIIIWIILSSTKYVCAQDCVLTTVFKEIRKLPFIEKAPSNEGLFKDYYGKAAKMIGCDLKILRIPKAESYKLLDNGVIDFYPKSGDQDSKKEMFYLVPIGLRKKSNTWGVTVNDPSIPELYSLQDVADNGLTIILEEGNTEIAEANKVNLPILYTKSISPKVFFEIIESNKKIYFKGQAYQLMDHIKSYGININSFKFHKNIHLPYYRVYHLGFSKTSTKIKFKKGAAPKQERITDEDYEKDLDPKCIIFKFIQALRKIHDNGDLKIMLKKYKDNEYFPYFVVD